MRGWKASITYSAAETNLSDTFQTDEERTELCAPLADVDLADRWSYSLLDADLAIHGSSLPIDGHHQTGWLAFA